MMKKLPKLNERGFSLVEALVTLVLLTVILLMLYELMIGSMRASMFVESRNDLEIFAQRTVNDVQAAILQSRMMYQETGIGPGYRTLILNSDLGWAVYPNSRLPRVDNDPDAIMQPDADTELFVGNSVLLVRALEPVPVAFDHDEDGGATTPNIDFLVDRYRLEYYFLSLNPNRRFNSTSSFLDLIRARTIDYADYFQLSSAFGALSAAQQNQIADAMLALPAGLTTAEATRLQVDGPIDQAWDPAVAAVNAFYDMDDAGERLPGTAPSLPMRMASDPLSASRRGSLSGTRLVASADNSSVPRRSLGRQVSSTARNAGGKTHGLDAGAGDGPRDRCRSS